MGHPRTLGAAVSTYVDDQIAVILAARERLLDGDIATIHPTRVAIRRLRSTLRTFDVYRASAATALNDELAWFATLLGDVRDVDVVWRRLDDALDGTDDRAAADAARAALRVEADARIRRGWAGIHAALGSSRYDELAATLRRWTATPPLRGRSQRPAAAVVDYLDAAGGKLTKRLNHAAEAIAADDPDAVDRAHSARKAGKRYRYAAELALPAVGETGKELIKRGRRLQNALGEQQDAATALDFLADLAETADDAAMPALEELRRHERAILAEAAHVLAAAVNAPI